MLIYLAAPYETIPTMLRYASALTDAGHTVCSQWLYGDPDDTTLRPADAARDLADIQTADVVVVYNPPSFLQAGTGGRHVELGYALALRKPVALVGARSNVFHTLPAIRVVVGLESLLAVLPTLVPDSRKGDARWGDCAGNVPARRLNVDGIF